MLAQLTEAYQRFHLPTTLAELEVDINNQAEIDKVIAHTLRPVESIHYLPVTLTPDTLRAAFEKSGIVSSLTYQFSSSARRLFHRSARPAAHGKTLRRSSAFDRDG